MLGLARGYGYDGIALDDGTTTESPALFKLPRGKANAAAMADSPVLYPHSAATTTSLPTAWQVEHDASLDCCIR